MTAAVLIENHPVRDAASRRGLPPSLVVQRRKGAQKVEEEGRCRMCRRPAAVRPLTRHHLVAEAWFRARPKLQPLRDCDANIVPLCDPCHRLIEKPLRRSAPYRRELRRALGSAEVAFVLRVAGEEWAESRYPSRGVAVGPAR